jgi:hypothetical protein
VQLACLTVLLTVAFCLDFCRLQLEAKLVNLQQQHKVSHVQLQTLKSSIDLRRQRLADTKRRLKVLEG